MKNLRNLFNIFIMFFCCLGHGQCDTYNTLIEPAPDEQFASAEYTLWIPKGLDKVERIILHQHGCGKWAQSAGRTVTDDLHWKLLAEKTNAALLGSSLWPVKDCREWCDPDNGTERAFFEALDKLSEISAHPEIKSVNWAVWGHSGGGYWTQSMLLKYPERFDAVVFQSASLSDETTSGTSLESLPYPINVPILVHIGLGEKDHENFSQIYVDALLFFKSMRARGAPITLAIDPKTGHNAGKSRYLSIPWLFEVIEGGRRTSETIWPSEHSTDGIWFPDSKIAEKWKAFSELGMVPDQSIPEIPPFNVRAVRTYQGVALTWDAYADWESGIKTFRVYRDGKLLPPYKTPLRPIDKDGFTENFRDPGNMDTPNIPLSKMLYTDTSAEEGVGYSYEVSLINWSGLESDKSSVTAIK